MLKPKPETTNTRDTAGFTLVELILAMALLSFLLLIVSAGFLQVTKIYRSALAARTTQENARSVVEQVTRHARHAHTADKTGSGAFCLFGASNVRFRLVGPESNRLIIEQLPEANCGIPSIGEENMTDSDVLVPEFAVTLHEEDSDYQSFNLRVKVATNSSDLFDTTGGNVVCNPSLAGAEFCSTTVFTSSVTLRESRRGEL